MFLTDVEYIERIEMNPSSAAFDVTVTGMNLGLANQCFSFHRRIVHCGDSCSGPSNVWTDLNPIGSLEESRAYEHARYKLPRRGLAYHVRHYWSNIYYSFIRSTSNGTRLVYSMIIFHVVTVIATVQYESTDHVARRVAF